MDTSRCESCTLAQAEDEHSAVGVGEGRQGLPDRLRQLALGLLHFHVGDVPTEYAEVRPETEPSAWIDRFYAGRPAIPTGSLILDALADFPLIPVTGQSPSAIPPTDLQLRLLDLFGIDPRDLWLKITRMRKTGLVRHSFPNQARFCTD